MTPAELVAWAGRMESNAVELQGFIGDTGSLSVIEAEKALRFLTDLRLAARLARFAAERGGLEEDGNDGTI